MKVVIDHDLCRGIGNCVAIAPEVFQLNKQNKAVAKNIDTISEEKIMEAAESCPLDAIIVLNEHGDQLYP